MSLLKMIRKSRARAYKYAKVMGDVQAVVGGTVVQRAAQRVAGKASRKAMNKVLPKVMRKKR